MSEATEKTKEHIANVRAKLKEIIQTLEYRGYVHDKSKLEEPEVSTFDIYTQKLKGSTYGSDEYKQFLKEMKPALDHHYENNRHHPEFVPYRDVSYVEQWKQIKGYEGIYSISNFGRVRIDKSGVVRKVHETPKGYLRLQLSNSGIGKNFLVHRLVAENFIENPDEKSQVNHRDCNKKNNHYTNLEWVNNSENQVHAYENGLQEIKYVVHCEELNITTFGTGEMERQLLQKGYNKARDSTILACITGRSKHHLGLHFSGYIIDSLETRAKSCIDGMNLIDIIEMFCDWLASTERHADGNIYKSIKINKERFKISDQLCSIFENTASEIFNKEKSTEGDE